MIVEPKDLKGLVVLFAVRSIPFCVGYGLAGPIIFGDKVAVLEEMRQEVKKTKHDNIF